MGCRRYGGSMIELLRRRMMGGSAKLYDAEVEYLVARYVPLHIPSGILMKRGYDFGIKIANLAIYSNTKNSWLPLIGTKYSSQRAMVYVSVWNNIDSKGDIAVDWQNSTTGSVSNIASANTIFEVKFLNIGNNKAGFYINNTKYREFTYFNFPNNINSEIRIGYPGETTQIYFGYIYNFFIRDEHGQYVFNAVPVRKGQTAYMYDTVSKRLLSNQSSNFPFIPGPDKTA